ncbi:MAG: TetR/AcrR family transcriptional regulator, partial [Bacteroidota bacterium]
MYKYFENKENLYLAVVNKSFHLFLENFVDLRLTGNNGLEKVLAYAQGYISFYKRFPKNYLMILDFYTLLNSLNNKSFQSDA